MFVMSSVQRYMLFCSFMEVQYLVCDMELFNEEVINVIEENSYYIFVII